MHSRFGAEDSRGKRCQFYQTHWATCDGSYDDDDFTATKMCCGCGGGFTWELGSLEGNWSKNASYCYDDMGNGQSNSYVVFERGVRAWCSSVVFEHGVRTWCSNMVFENANRITRSWNITRTLEILALRARIHALECNQRSNTGAETLAKTTLQARAIVFIEMTPILLPRPCVARVVEDKQECATIRTMELQTLKGTLV